MSERSEKALELFKSGFNCSQAIFAPFAKNLGLDEETSLKLACGFGNGIARKGEVCSAVTVAALISGLLYGSADSKDAKSLGQTYEEIQRVEKLFCKKHGSSLCRELRENGQPDSDEKNKYKKRPCDELIEDAVVLIEKVMFEDEVDKYGKD